MKLDDIIRRTVPAGPWAEGDTVPWSEPGFSRRMLAEHFSQEHDAASRRTETIDAHTGWIHSELLAGQPSRVLDLGCGPGLYMERLARQGHAVTGVDYSPASVAHARKTAERDGLPVTVVEGDMRKADFGGPYDLAMLIAGELNVFRPEEARDIVRRAAE
ncbi:MAG TPA: class I SAM-dependent methyltransferase, partial [Dehalococcoidia bacterium]